MDFAGRNGRHAADGRLGTQHAPANCSVTAGLDLTKVFGMVMARGSWNGYELVNRGGIRLDSLEVLRCLSLDSSSYSMTDKETGTGSRDAMLNTHPHNIPTDDQFQAQA